MIHTKDLILPQTDFPFSIFNSTGLSAQLPPEEIRLHNHDCLEINYVIHDGGYYLIGDQRYELHEGDIIILNNQEYHYAITTDMLLLKVMVFNAELVWNGSPMDYMYLKAFFEKKQNYSPFIPAELPLAQTIAAILFDIEKEWKEQKAGYRILIKAHLMKMLALIYRYYEEEQNFEPHPADKRHLCILRAVDHINAHYTEHLTLKSLADMVHMSENYFSTLFGEIMHMPFSQYILEKRLNHACMLLKTTVESITAISLQSGFSSISYFNRSFKKRYGLSPGKYRSEYQIAEQNIGK